MNLEIITDSEIFKWIILPLLIVLARILDVCLGTIRIVFISKGLKYLAPIIGFFEVLIWLITIRVIMQNLNNIACYIAYGLGFAMGTFIGLQVEKRLAIGKSIIRIITQKNATELVEHLREKGFGVTSLDAHGAKGNVGVIYMIVRRHDLENVGTIIKKLNPNAFYTVEDVRMVSKGVFPLKKVHRPSISLINLHRFWRKGK